MKSLVIDMTCTTRPMIRMICDKKLSSKDLRTLQRGRPNTVLHALNFNAYTHLAIFCHDVPSMELHAGAQSGQARSTRIRTIHPTHHDLNFFLFFPSLSP